MSWPAAIVLIVLISAIAGLMRSRRGGGYRSRREEREARQLPSEREVDDLRERIKVLERITTEGHSAEASETRRIAAEIEALRDQRQDG